MAEKIRISLNRYAPLVLIAVSSLIFIINFRKRVGKPYRLTAARNVAIAIHGHTFYK
jgi:hypothetical protein